MHGGRPGRAARPAAVWEGHDHHPPGESYDLAFNAWAAPGSVYPFHCHILYHVVNPGQSGDEMGGLIVLVKYAS